jgi:hypothetical protein
MQKIIKGNYVYFFRLLVHLYHLTKLKEQFDHIEQFYILLWAKNNFYQIKNLIF